MKLPRCSQCGERRECKLTIAKGKETINVCTQCFQAHQRTFVVEAQTPGTKAHTLMNGLLNIMTAGMDPREAARVRAGAARLIKDRARSNTKH